MKRWLALSCIAVAVPAHAQQSDATDGLGSVASENPFGRDRNTSVLERNHPEYTPQPARIGALEVLPRIAIGAGYDDNIYAQPSGREIGDAYVRIRPRVSVTRPSETLRLNLSGELDLLRYADRTTENATQYNLGASAAYTISRDNRLNLSLAHGRFLQERVSPDSPEQVIRPVRFTVTEGTAAYSHAFNRLRIQGIGSIERRDYRDEVNTLGDVVDQDFRDRTTYTGTGIGEYALNPSVALFVAGSYNVRDYRTRLGPVPARSSTGWELAAGSSFELGRKMRGSLRAGYLQQDYDDPFFQDVSGFLIRGELAYFLSSLVTITGTVDRSVSETGIIGATAYLKTTSSLRADYELLRNLILSAGAELEKRDFSGIARDDDRWTLRTSATYSVNHRLQLRADIQRRTQSSSGANAGRNFADNRISVGVTFLGL